MTLGLTLPLANLRPVRIRDLDGSALCLSYDNRGIHIFLDQFEGDSRAILLNGEHAFHSLEIADFHNWKGLAITEFEFVVDVGSAIDTENRSAPLGALSLGSDGVQIQVAIRNGYGFTDTTALKLGIDGPSIAPGLRASFTRWAFQIGEKDQAEHFWIDAKVDEE